MMQLKKAFVLLALAVVLAQAKPSFPYGWQPLPDHLDFAPPVLPPPGHLHDPAHLHAPIELQAPWPGPAPLLPAPTPLIPAPAQFLPHPLPAPFFHAPTQVLHAPAPAIHAPVAPLLPAPTAFVHPQFVAAPPPAPLLPTPVLPAPILPAPLPITEVHPPVFEAIPFATPIPSYRAIPGPKTTTHHISVGYAFPHNHFGRTLVGPHAHHLHAAPHAHLRAAPLALGHHHHHPSFF